MNINFTATLTVDDLLTSSGKYPARAKSLELTPEKMINAQEFIRRLNGLLSDISTNEYPKAYSFSSGFRTSEANKLAGGAKVSAHMMCKAGDLLDMTKILAPLIQSKPQLLKKWGLMIENPEKTKGWCHLDMVERTPRISQMFNP